MTPRYVVRAVRFGPFPWVVVDRTRDVIVQACRTEEDAYHHASALEEL